VRTNWLAIGATNPQSLVKNPIEAVIIELAHTHIMSQRMLADAADLRTLLADPQSLLQIHIDQITVAEEKAEWQLELAQKQVRETESRIAHLKQTLQELETPTGLLKQVLEAAKELVYEGRYPEVLRELEEAEVLWNKYRVEKQRVEAERRRLNDTRRALESSMTALHQVSAVDSALAGYQNALTAALTAIDEAHDDEEDAVQASRTTLANFYQRRAGKHMEQLLAWIDVFEQSS
jgi:chromosome segregation ATPase